MDHLAPGEAVVTGGLDPEVRDLLDGPGKEKPAPGNPHGAARLHKT